MYHERKGNLHIHTRLSDGSGLFDQVRQAARQAGLDWILVTDHNALTLEEEGWHDGLLTLVGQELHDPAHPHQNHLLVFGVHADLSSMAGELASAIDEVHAQGGLCFIAHPFEHSGAFADEPEINWLAWDLADRADGLELWNYMSEFKSLLSNAFTSLIMALWPKLGLVGPYVETLSRWDELLQAKPYIGIGGSDAHAGTYSMGPIQRQVFGYEHLFGAVNMHVLVDGAWSHKAQTDCSRLLEALGAGRCFIAYDALCDASGFQFQLRTATGELHPMGANVPWMPDARLSVQAPARARLQIYKDGRVAISTHGSSLELPVKEPGVYRAIAYRRYAVRWRTWIVGNAIRVGLI